jgi:hypothetical protein
MGLKQTTKKGTVCEGLVDKTVHTHTHTHTHTHIHTHTDVIYLKTDVSTVCLYRKNCTYVIAFFKTLKATIEVTIHTTVFNMQRLYILPTERLCVFCMDLKTEITSFYSTNRLVFITETMCSLRGTN